jgi:DNA polymerase-4
LLRYPELKGLPVVIGGGRRHQPVTTTDPATGRAVRTFATLRSYVGRGVITTATYEARAFGLHSAMGMMKAAQLAPDTILLPVDFDAYRKYSRLFKDAVRAIAPRIQDNGSTRSTSISRTCIRPRTVSSCRNPNANPWERVHAVARAIKQAVRAATGLSCSIGIASNKLLAKIASELDKPDGLTLLRPEDIERRIWPLPARKINGIGPKSGAKLEALGVRTIAELAAADPAWLVEHFGRAHGAFMHEAAHGRDDRDVLTEMEPKSISRELTFERDLSPRRDRDELTQIFTALCTGVSDDLKRKGYLGKTIGLKLRYDNFKTVTRDRTLDWPTDDPQAIRQAAGECLKRVPLDRRIRLLGVRAGALFAASAVAARPPPDAADATPSLFDESPTR